MSQPQYFAGPQPPSDPGFVQSAQWQQVEGASPSDRGPGGEQVNPSFSTSLPGATEHSGNAQGLAQPQHHFAHPGAAPNWGPAQAGNYPVNPVPARLMVQIGGIVVTSEQVQTPAGSIPLHLASFTVLDQTRTIRVTPTWAKVAALAGFFVLTVFSLLFLLVKEDQTQGQVLVGVVGGNVNYQEPVVILNRAQAQDVISRVGYAEQLVRSMRG